MVNYISYQTNNSLTFIGLEKDWFDKPEIKKGFKAKYGYDLGVPVNWSAYEDIADYFTNDVKNIDGVRVYGHMDYGKRAPDLGWRMTTRGYQWLAQALWENQMVYQ